MDNYTASLEARIEEYEKQLANKIPVAINEAEFIEVAKKHLENEIDISYHRVAEYLELPPPKNIFQKIRRSFRICRKEIWEKIQEYGFAICAIAAVAILIGGISLAIYSDYKNRQNAAHIAEISLKIDALFNVDINSDGVVTDDERRIVVRQFAVDNGLTSNEEDFYNCIRNKTYSNIFKRGSDLLGVDDIYELASKQKEKHETTSRPILTYF